jgi:hypothetical protein
VTDWGIPDWRDPGAYGDTGQWCKFRWRWEFTRRRDDCRADFEQHAQATYEVYRKRSDQVLQPSQRGFVAEFRGCYEKYGLLSLPNPAISEQPVWVTQFGFVPPHVRLPDRPVLHWHDHNRGGDERYVGFVFNVYENIDLQLKQVRWALEYQQKKLLGKRAVRHRKHPAKWPSYLRVLDARESGASWSEIARSDVLGPNRGRKVAQTARDVWAAANALRFNWPT